MSQVFFSKLFNHVNIKAGVIKNLFQRRILAILRKNNCREIALERQRLLFNNQILQPDNSPIYWIAGIGPDCRIHLVENNPMENNYRSIAQIDSNPGYVSNNLDIPKDERELELRQLAHQRFNSCR